MGALYLKRKTCLPFSLLVMSAFASCQEHDTESVSTQIKKHLPGTEAHKEHKANKDSGMTGGAGGGMGGAGTDPNMGGGMGGAGTDPNVGGGVGGGANQY